MRSFWNLLFLLVGIGIGLFFAPSYKRRTKARLSKLFDPCPADPIEMLPEQFRHGMYILGADYPLETVAEHLRREERIGDFLDWHDRNRVQLPDHYRTAMSMTPEERRQWYAVHERERARFMSDEDEDE